jgi:hypothetical protein
MIQARGRVVSGTARLLVFVPELAVLMGHEFITFPNRLGGPTVKPVSGWNLEVRSASGIISTRDIHMTRKCLSTHIVPILLHGTDPGCADLLVLLIDQSPLDYINSLNPKFR